MNREDEHSSGISSYDDERVEKTSTKQNAFIQPLINAKSVLHPYSRNKSSRNKLKKSKIVNDVYLQALDVLLQENSVQNTFQMAKQLEISTGIKVYPTTLYSAIRKLKVTLKQNPTGRHDMNSSETIMSRKEHATHMNEMFNENQQKVIFIDKITFKYHLKKTTAKKRQPFITAIMAISVDGVIHINALPNTEITSAGICIFFIELLEKLEAKKLQGAKLIISDEITNINTDLDDLVGYLYEIFFFPPCSNDFNPVLAAFSQVKTYIRENLGNNIIEPDKLLDILKDGVRTVNEIDCRSYIIDVMKRTYDYQYNKEEAH